MQTATSEEKKESTQVPPAALQTATGEHTVHDTPSHEAIKRVVCIAVDPSGYSEYAFHWALENFVNPKSDLVVLLNVRPVPNVPGPFGTAYMDFTDYLGQIEEQNRQQSHALLHYYVNIVKEHSCAVKAIALRGDPRDEVVRKVKELNADILIIGCRGLGMIKRTFLGSISDYCVHNVDCPTLVVRHPNPEALQQYSAHARQEIDKRMKEAQEKHAKRVQEGPSYAEAAQHAPLIPPAAMS